MGRASGCACVGGECRAPRLFLLLRLTPLAFFSFSLVCCYVVCLCQKLSNFLERALSEELIVDGTLAQDTSQSRALWQLRETITEGLAKEGAVYKYDISLPVKSMYDMVDKMRRRLAGRVGGVVGYGHLGDGNLHLNVHTPKFEPQVLALIEPYLFEQTGQMT